MRVLLCMLTLLCLAFSSNASTKSFLSVDASPLTLIDKPDDDAVERVGRIRFNKSALNFGHERFSAKSVDTSSSLTIELFDDLKLTLNRKRSYENTSGKLVWIGTVSGSPFSAANFIIDNDGVTGNIRYKGKLYQIRSQQDQGSSKVLQLDAAKLKLTDELKVSKAHKKQVLAKNSFNQKSSQTKTVAKEQYAPIIFPVEKTSRGFENTNQIDVLVYYSNRALAREPDLLDAIELEFIDANLAFENSNIDYRVNMVTAQAIDDKELLGQDNLYLMVNRESHFRQLDSESYKYQADLVHFFGYGFGFAFCGQAYISVEFDGTVWPQGNVGATSPNCTGNLTFAHEIGHNLGAHHERYIQDYIQEGDYAFGYVDTENGFKTLMSYGDECLNSGTSCETITHFSNPDILYNGLSTGIDEQQQDSAHNQKIIELGGATVANYGGLTVPLNVTASNGGFLNKIDLSWDLYPNATSYQVFRVQLGNEQVCEILEPHGYYDYLIQYEGADAYYSDTNVTAGVNYCYYVRARNDGLLTGHYSPYSFPELGYVDNLISRIEDVNDVLIEGEAVYSIIVNTTGNSDLSAIVAQHNFGQVPELTIEQLAANKFNLTIENVNKKDGTVLIELATESGAKELFAASFSGFGNAAPVISDIAPQTIVQSGQLSIPVTISDDDHINALQVLLANNNRFIISEDEYELVALDKAGEYQINLDLQSVAIGKVGFSLSVNDGVNFVTKTFSLTIERTRYSSPVAQDITLHVEPNKTITRYFPVYDFDGDELTFKITSQPTKGSVNIEGSYHFSLTTEDSVGNDSFSFSVTDQSTGEAQTVIVNIKPAKPLTLAAQTKVMSFYEKTYLLNHQGEIWFWGEKDTKLGADDEYIAHVPEQILTGGWVDMEEDFNHLTYWLKHDGTLWITGYIDGEKYPLPLQISPDADWKYISCGHICFFVKTDGSVWLHNPNDFEQEYFSPSIVEQSFSQVVPLYNIEKLTTPLSGQLFFNADNKLYSWGDSYLGRKADMTKFGVVDLPTENLLSIQSTTWATYLHYKDRLVAWGVGPYGMFAEFEDPSTPVIIDNRNWSHFSFSNYYIMGVTDGALWSWGGREGGENYHLGRGAFPSNQPTQVDDANNWFMAFTGIDTSFAIKDDGTFWVVGGHLDYENSISSYSRLGLGENIYHVEEFTQNTSITPEILGFIDTDNDGTQDILDTDDDNDGVYDLADFAPNDATEWLDTDGDGIGNNADTDDDGDGVPDTEDAFPLDKNESVDTDGDGIGNNADTDDDGDGVVDSQDAFPLDASRSQQTSTNNNTNTQQEQSSGSSGGSMYFLLLLLALVKSYRLRVVNPK